MGRSPRVIRVHCSYHHAPPTEWRRILPSVLRAGWRQASPGEEVRRVGCPGQDLLYCRRGSGWIEREGRRWTVGAGRMAWLCNERPHAHGAAADDPWELYWLRFDGPGLAQLRLRLGVEADPVFPLSAPVAERWFGRLFGELEARNPAGEIALLGLLGELLAHLRATRRPEGDSAGITPGAPEGLRRAAEQMQLYPHQAWPAVKLARLAGMSVAHFNREFRRHFATSPRQWAITGRIQAAQRLLTETTQPVGQVAAASGYGDISHFSRDFRRHTGLTPLAYRSQEQAADPPAPPDPPQTGRPNPDPPPSTVILQSHYHTPGAAALAAFPVVVRAGHLQAAPDYRIERRSSPGHDLLFCLAGAGRLRVKNRTFAVTRNELLWINGYEPHMHWADPADPWEVLWLRMNGAGLEALQRFLGADENPVFQHVATAEVRGCFREILRLMAGPAMHREEHVHMVVARLVALLRRSRNMPGRTGRQPIPPQMEMVINRMALYPHHHWTTAELARIAGASVPRFYRQFRQITGSSPINWLRQERVNLAKRRLLEGDDSIKAVADQAGYNSPFFFSRDFKHHTGMSPSEFRRHERGESSTQPPPTPTMR